MHHLHLILTFLLFASLASAQPNKVNASVAPDSFQVEIMDTLWQGAELVVLVQVRDQNYALQVKKPASGNITAHDIQIGEPGLPAWDGSISFGTLLFDMGSDKSKDKNADKLLEALAEKVVQILKNDNSIRVEVHGHASPDGEEAANTLLSMRRAKTVYDKIVAYIERKYEDDVDALMNLNRMRFQFHGETRPLYPVTSSKNFENRRVEIITVKN
ncbi:MAG: OmpA family protein [Lewinellaceae bacterium]|nr:OmpA family protein [Lewinellaceae bacterium]